MQWAKGLLIILFSSFIGIISNPEMLMASDSVALTGIDNTMIVETVPLPEPAATVEEVIATFEEPVAEPTSQPSYTPTTVYIPEVAPEPAYIVPHNNIQIGGKTIEVLNTSDTANDSGKNVLKYGTKFLYGHNSAEVFRVLYGVGVGSVFSVTENGVTTNYRVQATAVYEKVDDYTLRLDGKDIKMSVVVKARYNGVNYDLSLMTCYGTSYGNGDASHRLVLFASAI